MLQLQEHVALAPKTTMRVGGKARAYAELKTREDALEAYAFSQKRNCPLVILGGGSNTIFDDEVIEALVVRIVADNVTITRHPEEARPTVLRQAQDDVGAGRLEGRVLVEAGKSLASLVNELAEQGLDLSPLTGIPGTVGGAVFGNAGQGHGGIWIGNYVREVEAFVGGEWKRLNGGDLKFTYRWSSFKEMPSPIIWAVTLAVPHRPKKEVKAEIQRLLKKRMESQPHTKTAGSCFLSLPDGTPAWKLIDAAGLRGKSVGAVRVSEKHANFLITGKGAAFSDARALVEHIQQSVSKPLVVEMRFIGKDGRPVF
jgi:UDP-N-acetylmuramate dehydrogenase